MRLWAFLLLCLPLAAADLTIAGPAGRVQFQLSWTGKSRLEYSVLLAGKPVIESSFLGVIIDGVNLAEGVETGQAERYQVDETYPWNGPHSSAVNKGNGVRLAVTHRRTHTPYTLEYPRL